MATNSMGRLLCGHEQAEGGAKIALDQLRSSINDFSSRAVRFVNEGPSDEARTYGAFCARVILENGCAAMVGRLDAFRMLYLSELQAQPDYEYERRAGTGFSWTGDVMPDDRSPPNPLFGPDHDMKKVGRALFSKHWEHIYWKPAVEKMLDCVSSQPQNPALAELLTFDIDGYVGRARGEASRLYSTLSKGVHWEFFTSSLLFDETTIKSTIRDSCLLVAHLGLTSHFVPTAYASLSNDQAIEAYLNLRRDLP